MKMKIYVCLLDIEMLQIVNNQIDTLLMFVLCGVLIFICIYNMYLYL